MLELLIRVLYVRLHIKNFLVKFNLAWPLIIWLGLIKLFFLMFLTVFKSGTYDSSLKRWLVVVVDVDCLFWWSLMSDQVSLKWGEVWAIYGWIIGWIVLVHDWTFFLDVGDLLIGKYWNVRIIRLSWFKTFEMSMVRPTRWMI